MSEERNNCLSVEIRDRVARLTIDNPPINLLDTPLIRELSRAVSQLAEDEGVGAVVVQSADPDFFIAHGNVNTILDSAGGDPSQRSNSAPFQAILEGFRKMPKPTIGKVDGIARGGGLELLAALDMRFCSLENTRLSQPEVALGIIPGGGGTGRWPRLIGYGRAMEVLLGCADIDAQTAERYGMVNRAMPAVDLDAFVNDLARNIASFPPHAVALAKQVAQHEGELEAVLSTEAEAYAQSADHPDAIAAMRQFMACGGQTREVETGDLLKTLTSMRP